MNSWKLTVFGFSILWALIWIGWTVDIYLVDEVLVFPFVELALAIPIVIVTIWVLVNRIMNSLRRKTDN
jgi:hypothetical protein